jgi:hypothetical protein
VKRIHKGIPVRVTLKPQIPKVFRVQEYKTIYIKYQLWREPAQLSTATRLWVGEPRSQGTIPSRGKIFFCSP